MDDKFVLREEKGVRLDFPGTSNNLSLLLRRKLRQVVNKLDGVLGGGHNEVEVEFKGPDALAPEVVSLQHQHVFHRLISVLELQAQAYLGELEEVRSKVVSDEPLTGIVLLFRDIYLSVFLNIDQG